MIDILIKITVCRILLRVIVSVIRHLKLMNIYILKIAHAKDI